MNTPDAKPPRPYGPGRLQSAFNTVATPVIVGFATLGGWVDACLSYVANRVACCAACSERFEGVLRHPLTTVVVLVIGISVNTYVQIKAGHRDSAAVAAQTHADSELVARSLAAVAHEQSDFDTSSRAVRTKLVDSHTVLHTEDAVIVANEAAILDGVARVAAYLKVPLATTRAATLPTTQPTARQ